MTWSFGIKGGPKTLGGTYELQWCHSYSSNPFKLPGIKLKHLNTFTFTSFTPILHILMNRYKLLDCARFRVLLLGNDLSSFSFFLKMVDTTGMDDIYKLHKDKHVLFFMRKYIINTMLAYTGLLLPGFYNFFQNFKEKSSRMTAIAKFLHVAEPG